VIPKGLFTERLLAWVNTSKYMDGLPLYRQAALLGRFGGSDISRNTLSASVMRVGQAVQPIINLLLETPLIYGDETEIQVLKEVGRKAQTKSYMWAQMTEGSGAAGTGPPIRLFAYTPTRSTEAALRLYAGAGHGSVLMTDGYAPYNQVAKTGKLAHLACWAHCRRCFNDALQALPKDKRAPEQLTVQFIAPIGELHPVELVASQAGLAATALTTRRAERSLPVLDKIKALLPANLHMVASKTLLGKALHYAQRQWLKFERFVGNGNYPIDNNACENLIRPFVIGRRNWLFADMVAGAIASANLYSLLQTCKVNQINGYQYLRQLLIALPTAKTADDFDALLPWTIGLVVT
jgi:transposase